MADEKFCGFSDKHFRLELLQSRKKEIRQSRNKKGFIKHFNELDEVWEQGKILSTFLPEITQARKKV